MKHGFANRSWLTVLVWSAASLGTTGCELIPGLLGTGGSPDPSFTSAPLTVTVESASGIVDGVSLDTSIVEASGFRTGSSLQLMVEVPAQGVSVSVFTPGTESSSQNPYSHGDPGFGEPHPIDAGPPPDRFDPSGDPEDADDGLPIGFGFDPNEASIMVCTPAGACRHPDDFGLEIAQAADGRSVVLDSLFGGGDRVHLELTYREQR